MQKLLLVLFLMIGSTAFAEPLCGGGEAFPDLQTHSESLARWQDLRFGMFIHWGPVSVKGTEIGWSRGREIPIEEYDQLYQQFNPVEFDADEWVAIAQEAGMRYLILVTKHHDGFTLWDSRHTEYDIMASPFKRDIVKELSEACKKQGLLFGTYYSILDWHHPHYPLIKSRGGTKSGYDMDAYIDFMCNQLKELILYYDTRVLWFDGEWEDPWRHDQGMQLYAYVRGLAPELLVNNRVDKGRAGMDGHTLGSEFAGDFETPEQKIGAYSPDVPWESCIPICTQWAWKPDDDLKTKKECIQTLVRTAGGGGNLLLNVGPMPDGRIEPRQVERLQEIGAWLKENGESIYGTRGGPIAPQEWGVSTQRCNTIYLHVLSAETQTIVLDDSIRVRDVKCMHSDERVEFRTIPQGTQIDVPAGQHDGIDLVLVVERGITRL